MYGSDFLMAGLAGYFGLILGGDEDPAEFDDHVEVGRALLGGVPGRMIPLVADDVGVVAGEGVPDDDDALGVEAERDGAFDRRWSVRRARRAG
ncbi:hypothetical protein ACNTMW_25040 [Planosporangium sp. 12N6]|uniref:hypothetical protein n=1 Tax=Planosporangium spinosum TaxID=3402278 RepID=UPI003CF67B4D